MNHPLSLFMNFLPNVWDRKYWNEVLGDIADTMSCRLHTSGALAIKAGGGVLVKNSAACYGLVKGVPFVLAVNTDMPALSGTVVNATFNVFTFDRNAAGTITVTMGTPGATYAAVVFPKKRREEARLGFIIVNPTGTGDFVGNTTPLDDGTVAPNVVYVNLVSGYDQSIVR